MALVPDVEQSPTHRLVTMGLAGGVPLATYVATASGHGYWHDAGEFVAAGVQLGISHPPGHPLAGLLGFAATLIPLGAVAFRVALLSALCTSLAAVFLYRAIERTVCAQGIRSRRVSVPIALGATWLVAGSYGWWLQAVRPEVYALQALLSCVVLERVTALEAAWPTLEVRPLYPAALALGLALANHHFLAFLLLPVVAPTLARAQRAKGARVLLVCAGLVALGLSAYAYLPLRASAPLALGDPSSLGRLFWVVSAQAFQKSALGQPQPLGERFADVFVQLLDSLHPVPVLLALGGVYTVLRAPSARRIGAIWLGVMLFFGAGRAWLGFIRSNPDALGYLMPMFAAAGALGACFVAAALSALGKARQRPRPIVVGVAFALAVLGLLQFKDTATRASLARFDATDAFEELSRRRLPDRAIVLAHNPQTIFRFWGGEAAEEMRPDVTLVPMPLLSYPNMVNRLVDAHPELSELLRSLLLEGSLREAELQSLATLRPLFVELDPRVDPALYGTLVPAGLLHRALPDRAYDDDRRGGVEQQREAWRALSALLPEASPGQDTASQRLWHYYLSALYLAASGEREAAREAVHAGQALNPAAAELNALGEALGPAGGDEDSAPLDVSGFMPTGSVER